jgi:cobalt-zinc-cadmium efflux system membrane fusion protein
MEFPWGFAMPYHPPFRSAPRLAAALLAAAALHPRAARADGETLTLSASQVAAIGIGPVATQAFPREQTVIATVDFNEDSETQVFPTNQGKLIQLFARTGDVVRKGDPLFTIDSPDLVAAESTYIAADGVATLTSHALVRARDLLLHKGIAQKDFEQAVSDEQTAAGALLAAKDALRLFGMSPVAIAQLPVSRRVEPALVVRSPVSGVVVARNGAPGVLVQPGTAPAPFTVADNATMWLLASAPESLSAELAQGQPVTATIDAYPGLAFTGRISAVTPVIDPNTRRFTLRAEVADPAHKLRSGMFGTETITTAAPLQALAVPENGVAREGDGTMSVWVTTDRTHFTRRTVHVGLTANGYRQILDGLQPGQLVVTDGAVFLSNILTADPT